MREFGRGWSSRASTRTSDTPTGAACCPGTAVTTGLLRGPQAPSRSRGTARGTGNLPHPGDSLSFPEKRKNWKHVNYHISLNHLISIHILTQNIVSSINSRFSRDWVIKPI